MLIKRAIGLPKGSGEPNREKVGTITRAQLEEIAQTKMEDLNASDMDAAVRMIAGTARSMGVVLAGSEEAMNVEIVDPTEKAEEEGAEVEEAEVTG